MTCRTWLAISAIALVSIFLFNVLVLSKVMDKLSKDVERSLSALSVSLQAQPRPVALSPEYRKYRQSKDGHTYDRPILKMQSASTEAMRQASNRATTTRPSDEVVLPAPAAPASPIVTKAAILDGAASPPATPLTPLTPIAAELPSVNSQLLLPSSASQVLAVPMFTRQNVRSAAAAPSAISAAKRCTHMTPEALQQFERISESLRMSGGEGKKHAIPFRIIWNYGLWDTPSQQSTSTQDDGTNILADGLVLTPTVIHAQIGVHQPQIVDRLNCWLELYPQPHWEQRLWNRQASMHFLRKYHHGLVSVYNSYSRSVQKSDLLRVLLLQTFGGIYLDLDVQPRGNSPEPMDSLFLTHQPGAQVLLFEEMRVSSAQAMATAQMYPIRGGKPEECQRIANYLLAGAAQHPFWDLLVGEMRRRAGHPLDGGDYDVLWTTGPALVTEVAYKAAGCTEKEVQSCVMASDCLADKTVPGLSSSASGDPVRQGLQIVLRPQDQLYFDHLTSASWRNRRDQRN